MDFESYLQSKKIDPKPFKRSLPEQYADFESIFNQVHPESFTAQKLFLINQIRRKFPWKEEVKVVEKKVQVKPKITPRIKR